MSERIQLCDNFARLGKLLGGCEPQLPKAAAGRVRWLLALSRDKNAPQQDHWLRGSAGSGFWPSEMPVWFGMHGKAGAGSLLSFQELPLEMLVEKELGW